MNPPSPRPRRRFSPTSFHAGYHREALERFETVDALGAKFAWHLRELGYAHERLGDPAAALQAHIERMRRRGVAGASMEELLRVAETEGLTGYWRWQYGRLTGLGDTSRC